MLNDVQMKNLETALTQHTHTQTESGGMNHLIWEQTGSPYIWKVCHTFEDYTLAHDGGYGMLALLKGDAVADVSNGDVEHGGSKVHVVGRKNYLKSRARLYVEVVEDEPKADKVRETMVGSFVGDDGEDYGIFLVLSGGMNFFTVAGALWSIQPTELMQAHCKGKTLEEGLQDWLDGRIKFQAENNCK